MMPLTWASSDTMLKLTQRQRFTSINIEIIKKLFLEISEIFHMMVQVYTVVIHA